MFLKFYLTFGEKLVILNVNQILKYWFVDVGRMSAYIFLWEWVHILFLVFPLSVFCFCLKIVVSLVGGFYRLAAFGLGVKNCKNRICAHYRQLL